MNTQPGLGALVRLALAFVCLLLSAFAFKTALVRLIGAVLAWMASALAFSVGGLLLLSAGWSLLRSWLDSRRRKA
jgi:hypothetical protein